MYQQSQLKLILALQLLLHSVEIGIEKYHVVYFDAFSPNIQPELWTTDVFEKIYSAMKQGGVLTTYCAKGEVRRNMQFAGFNVERLPGRSLSFSRMLSSMSSRRLPM